MERISCFFHPGELSFFMPVLSYFPRDLVEIFCVSNVEISSGADVRAQPYYQTFALNAVQQKGYALHPADNAALARSTRALCGAGIYYYYAWVDKRLLSRLPTACLVHAIDGSGAGDPTCRWFVAQHKSMAMQPAEGKISREGNPAAFNRLRALPPDKVSEYAYVGPYHLGEWETKRHDPKEQLRSELEEGLGVSLPAHKPVLAFYRDEVCQPEEYIPALRRLSRHASIIYKGFGDLKKDPVFQALNKDLFFWPSSAYAQNALRFGVDAILAGYCSGTFASSVMLGLKVLPFYTEKVRVRKNGNQCLYDYRHYLKGRGMAATLHRLLGTLVDINDRTRILLLLEHSEFWQGYKKLLPAVQKSVFGDYAIEGAAQKTAVLLLKALARGSMGEDAVALRPRATLPQPGCGR